MPLAAPALVTVGALSDMEIANGRVPVPAELVAVITTLKIVLDATTGVPEIKPFPSTFSPVGKVPVIPNDVGKLVAVI